MVDKSYRSKRVVVGVCGSVAAIKTPELVRELKKHDIEVYCVLSKSSRKIIHPNLLEWASKNDVITELTGKIEHVELCGADNGVDLLLICPATANTISKIASGIDDSTVTTFATTAIGSGIPIVIAPAMHISMYNNPFVVENIEKLKKNKIKFIEPKIEEQKAKLADVDEILGVVLRILDITLPKE